MTRRSQMCAMGGIAGPVLFAGGWVVGGLASDLSPVTDAISRLAAGGAGTLTTGGAGIRVVMTTGFVGFGLGVGAFAVELRRHLGGGAWVAALTTAVATLGVAATPLDTSPVLDRLHAVAAVTGYAALAATPVLAARGLATRDLGLAGGSAVSRRAVWSSYLAGGACAGLLLASLAGVAPGATQRLGLSVGHLWLGATAAILVRRDRR